MLLSRERFANGLRIYGIDQDEQQEYAGRFCAYLGGTAVPIRTLADAQAFHFPEVASPDVVLWDLHNSDEGDRGSSSPNSKPKLVSQVLANPGRAAFIVDEAVTVTEDELGARTLGDLVRRGPHFGLEVHVHPARHRLVRQSHRADDPERRGLQVVRTDGARELYEIAPSLGISPKERERIEKAGQGEGRW